MLEVPCESEAPRSPPTKGLSIDEIISAFNVGRVASRLGFKKAIHNRQRCIVWNEYLVERLKKRWSVEEGQQQF